MLGDQLAAFRVAVQFLTRLPVPGGAGPLADHARLLRQSVIYFPLVGTLIGMLTGGVILLSSQVWPWPIAVLLGLAFDALLTGAFHEDALADFCDAFGGGWTREQILEILKDSRLGTFGVLGLLTGVSLRAVALIHIDSSQLLMVLLASSTLGRWAILPAMALVPPVPERASIARDVAAQINWRVVGVGTLWMLPGYAWLLGFRPYLALGLVVGVTFAVWQFGRYVQHRIDGITGDCLGAACYVVQVVVLLAAIGSM